MKEMNKACPVVVRMNLGRREVLAFTHPVAGKQFVKGTIENGEAPLDAARRELLEESGLEAPVRLLFMGTRTIGHTQQQWHFFEWFAEGLPDMWFYLSEDDFGHTFSFFWHPLDDPLNDEWHPVFHEAFNFFAPRTSAE